MLGEVPLLGRLFKTTTKSRKERDLLVFLTPTVVSGFTEAEAERLASVDAAVAETRKILLTKAWKRHASVRRTVT